MEFSGFFETFFQPCLTVTAEILTRCVVSAKLLLVGPHCNY